MSEPPAPESKSSFWRITLVDLLVSIVIVVVVAAILISVLNSSPVSSNRASCASNLSQMYKAMCVYCSAFGKNKDYMPHVGDAFFTCLLGHTGPEHSNAYMMKAPCYGNLSLYVCPSSGNDETTVTPGGPMADYRGPARHPAVPSGISTALVDRVPPNYPIACDEPKNHKGAGGNVLRFDGSVSFRTDTEYTDACNKCTD